MTLAKGTNSYVTLAEADSYFDDRLDVAAWDNATDLQKSQALMTATKVLDSLEWTGVILSEVQPLAFPRTDSYFDPRLGYMTSLSSTVPSQIINATYELAYHLLNNDGILDNTGSVTDLDVGPISLKSVKSPSLVPPFIKRSIKMLLNNQGANTWWRAN
jgi:hypothetical protein